MAWYCFVTGKYQVRKTRLHGLFLQRLEVEGKEKKATKTVADITTGAILVIQWRPLDCTSEYRLQPPTHTEHIPCITHPSTHTSSVVKDPVSAARAGYIHPSYMQHKILIAKKRTRRILADHMSFLWPPNPLCHEAANNLRIFSWQTWTDRENMLRGGCHMAIRVLPNLPTPWFNSCFFPTCIASHDPGSWATQSFGTRYAVLWMSSFFRLTTA